MGHKYKFDIKERYLFSLTILLYCYRYFFCNAFLMMQYDNTFIWYQRYAGKCLTLGPFNYFQSKIYSLNI